MRLIRHKYNLSLENTPHSCVHSAMWQHRTLDGRQRCEHAYSLLQAGDMIVWRIVSRTTVTCKLHLPTSKSIGAKLSSTRA